MKPPDETRSGGSVSRTAAYAKPPTAKPKADVLAESVKQLRQRARFYFDRFQRTGDDLDIRRATMMQAALVGLLEARRP